MIRQENIDDAKIDFKKNFGNHEEPSVRMDRLAGEEVIIIENEKKRAFYSVRVELIKVINLLEES